MDVPFTILIDSSSISESSSFTFKNLYFLHCMGEDKEGRVLYVDIKWSKNQYREIFTSSFHLISMADNCHVPC